MVKYFEENTTFYFDWKQVVQGFWIKYPNPYSSHVLSEDTISREVKDGKLYSKRLLTKTNGVPKWGEMFVKKNSVKIVEESILDPEAKTLTTYSRNFTYNKAMSVVEKVVYRVSDENPSWTMVHRSAWIWSRVLGFSKAIEAFGQDRLRKNYIKMSLGFNYILGCMFPQTAQLATSHLNYQPDDLTMIKSTLAEELQHSLQDKAEKVKDAAKKASDLAKQKTGQFM
ncbi:hypothetical protein KPH14_010843 [Odynerus spinipes]|uniref:PRELI/MSF1 domain-containing protein n=1 Tax=Odynerus spinipes TaxID=1348599 RepID=A0AAD9VM61_9HYME|nr:hypothetical protein KPH14_010843 [Odynerus spinipes]